MKLVFLCILFFPFAAYSQNKPGTKLHIKKAVGEIVLDGQLNEPDWVSADAAKDWFLNYPVDTARAPFQTEMKFTFSDKFLYVAVLAYDDESRDMINSLRRDFDYERNDNVGINIGPYNDFLNGFFFTMTPKNVQMDGTISNGGVGMEAFNIYWDNKWYSHVERYPDKWVCELAIPFKSFRYKSDIKEWNISLDRSDKKRNMKSGWIETPIQFNTGTFAYSGQLVWDDPIPPTRTNISLIPYISGGYSKDNESSGDQKSKDLGAGFDAKVGVTPSINLDLTVNPDFSQVEVDQQVINLTRFEFRFPERRQFFLENSDLSDRAGFAESRVFFSRRIGLVADSFGLFRRIPIAYGGRLSGSINKNWRINVLSMRTKENLDIGLPAQNYYVATVLRNFWKQSSFALTFVDKESSGVGKGDSLKFFHQTIFRHHLTDGVIARKRNIYNRVINGDLRLLSADNKWNSTSYLSKSFDAFNDDKNLSGGTDLKYSVRTLNAVVGGFLVGKNYNPEVGYVPGQSVYPGFSSVYSNILYKHYPQNPKIVYMGPTAIVSHVYVPGGTLVDRNYSLGYNVIFASTATLLATVNHVFQKLTAGFNPINPEQYISFEKNETFKWNNVSVKFQSDTRKLVNLLIGSTYGGFYNGTNLNVTGDLNWRYQPYGNISLRFDYNDLRLASGYGSEKLFLIGPRIDWTFSDKLFLTTYIQYNNLIDNINLNARLQWRYKPASDFFVVYTENYIADGLNTRNRALVFKLNYWFNL